MKKDKYTRNSKNKNQLILQKSNNNLSTIDLTNPDKVKEAISLFNLTQAKKSAIRIDAYNEVMDLVSNEVLQRFLDNDLREIPTGALLNCLQTISSIKEKETKGIQTISEEPQIQLQQNINISVQKDSLLPRDSKEKVIDTVKKILASAMQQQEEEIVNEEESNEVIVNETNLV